MSKIINSKTAVPSAAKDTIGPEKCGGIRVMKWKSCKATGWSVYEGIYVGPVDEGGNPHGRGEFLYDDGDYYVGDFEHGEWIAGGLIYGNEKAKYCLTKNADGKYGFSSTIPDEAASRYHPELNRNREGEFAAFRENAGDLLNVIGYGLAGRVLGWLRARDAPDDLVEMLSEHRKKQRKSVMKIFDFDDGAEGVYVGPVDEEEKPHGRGDFLYGSSGNYVGDFEHGEWIAGGIYYTNEEAKFRLTKNADGKYDWSSTIPDEEPARYPLQLNRNREGEFAAFRENAEDLLDGIGYGLAGGVLGWLRARDAPDNLVEMLSEHREKQRKTFLYKGGKVKKHTPALHQTHLNVDTSVTRIPEGAFTHCLFQSVTIPNSVQSIGRGAFLFGDSIQSIKIPNSVQSIGESAFGYCYSLQSIKIPNSVQSIGGKAFITCKSLQSVTIPTSVQSIGEFAFYNCSSLKSITIPSSVKKIEPSTFSNCSSLQSITIPSSVNVIRAYAFNECSSLQSITIPSSVKEIHTDAFKNCYSLYSIFIPPSTRVWPGVFSGCSLLEEAARDNNVKLETFLRNRTDHIPLHILCQDNEVSCDKIQRHLQKDKSAATKIDRKASTALHLLTANTFVTLEMLRLLCKNNTSASRKNVLKKYPLHILCANEKVNIDMVRELLLHYPQAVEAIDSDKKLPLHILCANKNTNLDMVIELVQRYPKALISRDKNKELPLMLAMSCILNKEILNYLFASHPINRSGAKNKTSETMLSSLANDFIKTIFSLPLASKEEEHGWVTFVSSKDILNLLDDGEGICSRKIEESKIKIVQSLAAAKDLSGKIAMNAATPQIQAALKCPLHRLCARKNISLEMVQELLLHYPEALTTKDSDQRYPIHILCTNTNTNFNIMHELVHHHPHALTSSDKNQQLPLHNLCANNNIKFDMLKELIDGHLNALTSPDGKHQLPIHIFCANSNVNFEMLKLLLDHYPQQALTSPNKNQQLPLHILSANKSANFDMLKALIEHHPKALTSPDKNQQLPLHILSATNEMTFNMAREFVQWYPETVASTDINQQIPLTFALSCNANKEVLNYLFASHPIDPSAAKNEKSATMLPSLANDYIKTIFSYPLTTKEGENGWVRFICSKEILNLLDDGESFCAKSIKDSTIEVVRSLAAAKDFSGRNAMEATVPQIQAAFHERLPADGLLAMFHRAEEGISSHELMNRFIDAALSEPRTEQMLLQVYEAGDNSTTAWHRLVTMESVGSENGMVFKISRAFRTIHKKKDPQGRRAYDIADARCKNEINRATLFCGKYRIGEKLHQSRTCIVFLAQCTNEGSRGSERDIVADKTTSGVTKKSSSSKEEEDLVVIKFMKNESMYRREVEGRKGLEDRFVISIQETSSQIDVWKENERDLYLNDGPYPFGIVMHAAKKNLMVTLFQERVNFKDACLIQFELGKSLKHMHDHGMLHADFKPLNAVRMDDSTWRLIDFDATVLIGKPVGAKTSSAYCPPEMTTIMQSKSGTYQPNIISSANAFSQVMLEVEDQTKLEKVISLRRYIPTGTKENSYRLVDDQYNEHNASYDLLQGDPSFDLWSYGVVLYLTLARKPLLGSDTSDNLVNALELRRLHLWSTANVEEAVNEVDSVLFFDFKEKDLAKRLAATELVGMLLQPDPQKRPKNFQEVLDHSFFQGILESSSSKMDDGVTGEGKVELEISSSVLPYSANRKQHWFMSKFHRAAALNKTDILSNRGIREKEKIHNVSKGINSQQHFLGKTPLHLAAELGQFKSLNALIDNNACTTTLKDCNGRTPVHSVIHSIEHAADRHDVKKVNNLLEVLKVFMSKQRSNFNEKVDGTDITAYDLGRTCKVKEVQELFRGFNMILGAINAHEEFNPEDFNALWYDSPLEQQHQLEEAIFSLLENWALNPQFKIKKHREYLKKCIFRLDIFGSSEHFDRMKNVAKLKMDDVHQDMFRIRDSMAETSEGGKKVIDKDKVPPIFTKGPQMCLEVKGDCVKLGRQSENMKKCVDEDVLVPLIRGVASEVSDEFKEQLKQALNSDFGFLTASKSPPITIAHQGGDCGGKVICVDDIHNAHTILQKNQNWQRWFTIAKVKGAGRMKTKTKEYVEENSWPGSEYIGDCLRAMIVCRGGKESGDTIYQTWLQLKKAFGIKKGHGRLKNNFATAGKLSGNQKPPDLLMNIILNVEGCMPMPAEIQVHHGDILELKESKTHLLYEIYRAESINSLKDSGKESNEPISHRKALEDKDKALEEKEKRIQDLEQKLLVLSQG